MTHSMKTMKKPFCVIYEASLIKEILVNDPNIYGLIFSKSDTSNEMKVWELSPMMFTPYMKPSAINDSNVSWAYIPENDASVFEYPNGGNLPSDDYSLQFFDTNPDFVLFSRDELLAILRETEDNCLYISGARIEYGIGRNDFRNAFGTTMYPTLKAETKFTGDDDMDEVYWNIAKGLPCPTLWHGAISRVIDIIKDSGSLESMPKKEYSDIPKGITVKEALNKVIEVLNKAE